MKHYGEKNYRTDGLGAVEARGVHPKGIGFSPVGSGRTGARSDEKHVAAGKVTAKPASRGGSTEQPQ